MDYPLKLDNAPSWKQVLTPANVSILSSVGLHAFILGLALPNLPFWERTASELDAPPIDTVGVIELTEAERSRLPEPAPLPDPSAFFSGALNPTATPNPALPAPPNAPLPNTPPLPPSASTLPPLPSLPSYPNLPPLSSYGTLRNFPIVNPPLPSLPAFRSSRSLPPRLPGPPGVLPAPSQETPLPPRPQFGQLPPPRGTDFITRAPLQRPENGATEPLPEPQMEDYGIDTPLATARDNDLTWQAKRGVAIKERVSLTGPYPPIACRNRTSATVVFNADGQGNTDLISASRFPIFNQLARQAVSGRSFTEPTQISVNFNYDPQICGALGAPSVTPPTAPETTETPVREATPTPPAPLAQPEAPRQEETPPTSPERPPVQESDTPPTRLPRPEAAPSENPAPPPPAPEPEQQSEPPQSQPSPEEQSQPEAPRPQATPATETAPTPTPRVPFGAESKQDRLLRQQRRSAPRPTPLPAPTQGPEADG